MWLVTPQIEPIDEPVQFFTAQHNCGFTNTSWPLKSFLLQTLVPQAESVLFPVQDFDFIFATIDKDKQRRIKPLVATAINSGERVVKERFGIDEDICTGDHACIRLSGCPSLSVKSLDDPLRDDPVAAIDETCVGCGNCGEVADAAVLCPSFFRADVIHNPNSWDRLKDRIRLPVIRYMQQRRERRAVSFEI